LESASWAFWGYFLQADLCFAQEVRAHMKTYTLPLRQPIIGESLVRSHPPGRPVAINCLSWQLNVLEHGRYLYNLNLRCQLPEF
jgi:hypothetical protein